MSKPKGEKMYGGLIRREKRVDNDRAGNTTVQHWDGRKDVTIRAPHVKVKAQAKENG